MTGTETLANQLRLQWAKLTAENPDLEAELARLGTRGGKNAKHRRGWEISPGHAITMACKIAGIPTANWWVLTGKKPNTAIPSIIAEYAVRRYRVIFGSLKGQKIKRRKTP